MVLLPPIVLPSPCHGSLSAEEKQLETELGRDKNSTCIKDDRVLFISLVPRHFFRACYWSCSHHTVLICCLFLSSHYSSFQFTLSAFHVLSSVFPLPSLTSVFSRHSPNKLHPKETHHTHTQKTNQNQTKKKRRKRKKAFVVLTFLLIRTEMLSSCTVPSKRESC